MSSQNTKATMPTTIRDIARSLQVSHTTVSRVLNGRGTEFISEDTRQRVYKAAREMNYRPNRAARALATGRTGTIALWVGDPVYPYFGSVLHHVETLLNRNELDLLYVPIRQVGRFIASRTVVDGILALDWGMSVEEFLDNSPLSPLPPIVNMGIYLSSRVDTVQVDLGSGTREAIAHLIASGRKRIGFVSAGRGLFDDDERRTAYRELVTEAGLEPFYIDIEEPPDEDVRANAHTRVATLLRESTIDPDALFCFSDDLVMGVYRGLRDAGRRIPDDVALIGCDGIKDLTYFDPPISTIAQPFTEMCAQAWQLLQRRMAQPDAPLEHILLKPTLLLRESSAGISALPQGERKTQVR